MSATVPAPAVRRTLPVAYSAPTWPVALRADDHAAVVWAELLLSGVRTCASDGTRFMAGCVL